jgi:hypothetical protein
MTETDQEIRLLALIRKVTKAILRHLVTKELTVEEWDDLRAELEEELRLWE